MIYQCIDFSQDWIWGSVLRLPLFEQEEERNREIGEHRGREFCYQQGHCRGSILWGSRGVKIERHQKFCPICWTCQSQHSDLNAAFNALSMHFRRLQWCCLPGLLLQRNLHRSGKHRTEYHGGKKLQGLVLYLHLIHDRSIQFTRLISHKI